MNVTISSSEIQQFIKIYLNKDNQVNLNNNLDISINTFPSLHVQTNILSNHNLYFDIKKGLVAGFNLTAMIRENIFKTLKDYNNDIYKFDLINNQIILKVKNIDFKTIVFDGELKVGIAYSTV